MNWAALAAMLGVHVIGMASPGPDIVLILRLATRSRRQALAAVAGIVTGASVWVSLTVAGMAAVLSAHPGLMAVIQVLGGAWLAWSGWGMLAAGLAARGATVPRMAPADDAAPAARYRQGLLTNLSNPKIVLFMAAVLSQFMPVGAPAWVQLFYLASLIASAVLWFSLVAVVFSTPAMTRRLLGAGPLIDMVAGAIFLVLAAVLLTGGGGTLFAAVVGYSGS
ncbi:LysE family transporter [Corynebacterium sphenisci]|nr:LysE family transporter [Corynebacterium sphenisci]